MHRIITALILFISLSLQAKVSLPAILGSHMVMQQQSQVKLWGWCDAAEDIIIKPSWSGQSYQTTGTGSAKWEVTIATPKAGGPYTISIQGKNEITLEDVLIGEVWICSGQSNMEWSANSGIDNQSEEVAKANYNQIRFFHVPRATAEYPLEDFRSGSWVVCTPETMRTFSAVGYFFGRAVHEGLKQPVGLINASWGGTPVEVWTTPATISKDEEFAQAKNLIQPSKWWPHDPGVTYHAMIHPVVKYNIAGALWYQGESNTANALTYSRMFPAMIQDWRRAWGYDFPFYYVQIAPFQYGTPMVGALVREAQLKSLSTPKTGMVVVSDIGDIYDIHPRNKTDVGKRLAAIALNNTYNQRQMPFSGPLYERMEISGNQIRVFFKHGEGLSMKENPGRELLISGPDGEFREAKYKIENDVLVVYHPDLANPQAVRYAFSNTGSGPLFNKHKWPASSFRTDSWKIILDQVNIETALSADRQSYQISLGSTPAVEKIVYTTDGSVPGLSSTVYQGPFSVEGTRSITARAIVDGKLSEVWRTEEVTINQASFRTPALNTRYSERYSAGGTQALTDTRLGSTNLNDGHWQGFQGENLDVIVDLGEEKSIGKIQIQFLQDQRSWVFAPVEVEFLTSTNGKKYKSVHHAEYQTSQDFNNQIVTVTKILLGKNEARYIQIKAKNIGNCPPGHPGSGQKAWLMADEIIID